jgi:hypothetical protein
VRRSASDLAAAPFAPEFVPKRNSALIATARIADDAARLEIGEERGFTWRVRLALLLV